MPNSSYVQYTSTAGQVNYPIGTIDGWLSPTFLTVTVGGVVKTVTTDYTLQTISGTPTIVLNTAPATGSIVRIARDTPKTVSTFQGDVVDFQDASILTAQDLDNAVVGLLHITQEAADTGNGALGPSADGTAWDANSKKIIALAAPSDPGDAVTKNYVDTLALYGKAQTVPQKWEFVATAGQTNFLLSPSPEPLATVPEMYLVTKNGVTVTPTGYTFSGGKGNISLSLDAPNAASLNDKVLIRNFGVARAVADAIAPGSITDVYLATGAVTPDKIASDAVTTVKINNLAVTEAKISAGAITNTKLGALAVQTANISNGAVTGEKIGTGAVDTDQLAAAAVTNTKIEDGTIGTAKLSTSVTVSTLSSPSTALDMNTQKITNLGTPTAATDAATKDYVDTAGGGIPATGIGVTDFPIGTYLGVRGVSATNSFLFATGTFTPLYNVPNNANNNVWNGTAVATLAWVVAVNTANFGDYRGYWSTLPAGWTALSGTWVLRGLTSASTGTAQFGLFQRIA
jgi:hypothetical protein